MIVEFSVKNFRSIKDLQTISFRATKLDSHQEKHPDVDKNNVVEVGGMRLLKTVGIYGANASGKSNVLLALRLFSETLKVPSTPDDRILSRLYQPFLFQEEPERTEVFFQIVIELEEKKYRYGFTIGKADYSNNGEKYFVSNEWLYGVKDKNQGKYFIREGLGVDTKQLPNSKNIPKLPHGHSIFLKHAASFDTGICYKIWNYFNFIYSVSDASDIREISFSLAENDIGKQLLLDFLSDFNLNYDNIKIERQSLDSKVLFGRHRRTTEVYLSKHSKDFNLETQESEGTKKLFYISGMLLSALRNPKVGFTCMLDEIDSNFHPALVIKLIKMFNDPKINKSNAQLLFTSHDTNLLDPAIMRRDQFYFTEKDEQDATRLYSLADLKGIRNDADFARQYLAGYYGAVPVLKDFKNEAIAEDV